MRGRKIVGCLISIMIGMGILIGGAYLFSPGVYVQAENYYVDNISSYLDIEKRIDSLKYSNPQYRAYSRDSIELMPEIDDLGFHTVFFHLPKSNINVFCKIDSNPERSSNKINIKLVGAKQNDKDSSWKYFNKKNLPEKENKTFKKEFEVEILDKLGSWKPKRWYNQ